MKVIFMGTPDFAACSLQKLIDDGFSVCAVYTQPDKPVGRNHEISEPPVKQIALRYSIPVFQPESMRDPKITQEIEAMHADIIAVVAYGKLLPLSVIQAAKYGAVNLHGSLLPKYRGAAPIQWSVLNGDTVTGLTTFYLTEAMDAGDIIFSEETEIGEFETSGELFSRMMVQGASLLSRTLSSIDDGTAPRVSQDHEKATYVGKLSKEMAAINWDQMPREVIKWIYGMQPWPVASASIHGETYKLFSAQYTDTRTDKLPGKVVSAGKQGLEIACADGKTIMITELQLAGKKRMAAADFLRGHPVPVDL